MRRRELRLCCLRSARLGRAGPCRAVCSLLRSYGTRPPAVGREWDGQELAAMGPNFLLPLYLLQAGHISWPPVTVLPGH